MSSTVDMIPGLALGRDAAIVAASLAVTLSDCPIIQPHPAAWIEDLIEDLVAQIDGHLTRQLNEILHAPPFQAMESAWRGLHYLVRNTATGGLLQIKVLDIGRAELDRDLMDGSWDTCRLFRLVHEVPFGTVGGVPFAYLVADFAFSHAPPDVRTLHQLGGIAAAAHLPILMGASPDLAGAQRWRDLDDLAVVSSAFEAPDHASWQDLRDRVESRYLGLCLPRVLARLAYGALGEAVEEFRFDEDVDPVEGRNLVWMNAAYAMAVNINDAQATYGWCTRFRGIESGGALVGVPAHSIADADGTWRFVSPAEAFVSERLEHELAKAGLIPLVHRRNTERLAFLSASSLFKPAKQQAPLDVYAEAARHLSARFANMFPNYRFAQILKCIARDSLGSFRDPAALAAYLQAWIDQYIDPDPLRSNELAQIRHPLAKGSITVEANEAVPTHWRAKLLLQPNYQLEGLEAFVPLEFIVPAMPPQ